MPDWLPGTATSAPYEQGVFRCRIIQHKQELEAPARSLLLRRGHTATIAAAAAAYATRYTTLKRFEGVRII